MRRVFILILAVSHCITFTQGQTTIEGKMTDQKTNEPIMFGTVALYQGNVLCGGTETDLDGAYFFNNVRPETYDLEFSLFGYVSKRIQEVGIKAGRTTKVDFHLKTDTLLPENFMALTCYQVPLVEHDNICLGSVVTAEKIGSLPAKNIGAIQAVEVVIPVEEEICMRSSRSGFTTYFIDSSRETPARKQPGLQSEAHPTDIFNTGIKDGNDKGYIHIFPNPASNILNVLIIGDGFIESAILSSTGQTLIRNEDVKDNYIMFDLQNLVSGLYFVKLVYKNKILTQSFFKMN